MKEKPTYILSFVMIHSIYTCEEVKKNRHWTFKKEAGARTWCMVQSRTHVNQSHELLLQQNRAGNNTNMTNEI